MYDNMGFKNDMVSFTLVILAFRAYLDEWPVNHGGFVVWVGTTSKIIRLYARLGLCS